MKRIYFFMKRFFKWKGFLLFFSVAKEMKWKENYFYQPSFCNLRKLDIISSFWAQLWSKWSLLGLSCRNEIGFSQIMDLWFISSSFTLTQAQNYFNRHNGVYWVQAYSETFYHYHNHGNWSDGPELHQARANFAAGIVTDEITQEKLLLVTGGFSTM